MKVLEFGEESAFFHAAVYHFGVACRHAAKRKLGELVALVACGPHRLRSLANVKHGLHYHVLNGGKILYGHRIFVGERLARPFLWREPSKVDARVKFEDEKIVHAELVQRILYVLLHAKQD